MAIIKGKTPDNTATLLAPVNIPITRPKIENAVPTLRTGCVVFDSDKITKNINENKAMGVMVIIVVAMNLDEKSLNS